MFIKIVIFLILILNLSYADNSIQIAPVNIPVEIVDIRQEKRESLNPPQRFELFNINITPDIHKDIFLTKEGVENLPILSIEKPKAYLGIPPSNAIMADAIENFTKGDFIFAYQKAEEFVRKYKDSPYLYYGYYILGYTEFKKGNLEKAGEFLEKSCSLKKLKENCLSYAIVSLLKGDFQNVQSVINDLPKDDPDTIFIMDTLKLLKDRDLNMRSTCGNVDLSLVEYCKYLKKYTEFFKGNYKNSLSLKFQINNLNIKKRTTVLDGFSYYLIGERSKSLDTFKKYVAEISVSDKLSNFALYGIGLSDESKTLEMAQILETRDENLSQDLYLVVGQKYGKDRNYLNSFLYFQKALYLSDRYKDVILKNIAVNMYNLGNYKYGFNIFKDVVNRSPDLKTILYTGYTAYRLKDYEEAQKQFLKLVDTEYKELALEYLADIYLNIKDDENFIETIKQLKTLNPEKAYDFLGWFFFERGDYKNAFKSFRNPYMKAVSAYNISDLKTSSKLIENSDDEKSTLLKAYIALKSQDIEKARQILKSIKDRDSRISEEASYLYAYTYFSEGNFDLATLEFKNFLNRYGYKDDDLTKKATLRIADSYFNMGETDLARQIYNDFISKNSGKQEAIDAAYNLLVLETKEGSTDNKKMIEDFIRRFPNYPLIPILKLQLAQIYTDEKDYQKAEDIYKEIIDTNTKESETALYKLGQLYYIKGDLESAVKVLTEFLNRYKNSENLFNVKLLLGEILEKQDKIDEALSVYYQISDNDDVKFRIANLLYRKGDYDNSLQYLEQLKEKYPDNKVVLLLIGKAYYKKGLTEEAIKFLQEGTKSDNPKISAESYYYLGLIFKDRKDFNKALNNFLNAIYINPDTDLVNVSSRFEAANILIKAEKRKEASCLLKEVLKYNDDTVRQKAESMLKNLPKCVY
ncbi:MAG: tetratricopeptide repeat protein [Hydrogenothermaceae bacterium]|nr:tetratricopeptide repeat protein [Hydrogenothermaceae bacterium]